MFTIGFFFLKKNFKTLKWVSLNCTDPALAPGDPPHLATVGRDDPEVSGDTVSTLHFYQVSHHDFLRIDLHLLSLSDDQSLLWKGQEPIVNCSTSTFALQEETRSHTLSDKTGFWHGELIRAFSAGLPSTSDHKTEREGPSQKPYAPAWMEPVPATYLRHHVLEGVHDLGALRFLVVGEAAGDDNYGC